MCTSHYGDTKTDVFICQLLYIHVVFMLLSIVVIDTLISSEV